MNITNIYVGLGIEGYPIPEFEMILRGIHQNKIKVNRNGMLMLDNGIIVKCIHEYYRPRGKAKIKPKKSVSNVCYYTQKDMGVTGIPNYECARCHQACIQLARDKQIVRCN